MADFRETKIKTLSEEHSRAFQEAVFEAGGRWQTSDKDLLPDREYIFVDGSLALTSASTLSYFESHNYSEIVFPLPSKGHIHAELMAQYAEDARTTDKPWDLYQIKTVLNTWKDIGSQFIFDSNCTYRRKPKTHNVHGVEIPDLRVSPKQGDYFYLVDPLSRSLFTVREHTKKLAVEKLAVKEWVERGLVYLHTEEGKQAAILHSKAMLGIA